MGIKTISQFWRKMAQLTKLRPCKDEVQQTSILSSAPKRLRRFYVKLFTKSTKRSPAAINNRRSVI